jgi:hypothetical protein
MEKHTVEDWEYIGRMLMHNSDGYEKFTKEQLMHVVKMVRHFVTQEEG